MIYLFSSTPKTVSETLKRLGKEFVLVSKDEFANFVQNLPVFSGTDLGISYDFGKIFPDALLEKLKIVNIHFSLLPKYRGAVPVEAAVMNGDSETGITFQWTDKEMDAGDILLTKKVGIEKNETSGMLQKKMDSLLPEMLTELFQEDDFTKWNQSKQGGEPTFCYKKMLSRENAQIHFEKMNAKEVERSIKAFNPEPLAWVAIKFQGQESIMNVLDATVYDESYSSSVKLSPKQIAWVKKQGMVVGTANGAILITEMVIAGKKPLKNGDIVSLKDKIEIL